MTHERRPHHPHEVLRASSRELAAGCAVAAFDPPSRVERVADLVHELEDVLVREVMKALEPFLDGFERAVHLVRGPSGGLADVLGVRHLAPQRELVEGRRYADQRGVRRIDAREVTDAPGEPQDVPEAGFELGDEASELGVHRGGAIAARVVPQEGSVHLPELMVQGADRRVRHGGHRHRVRDIARAQRTRSQFGEHHLRGGRRVERHRVGAGHDVARQRRLQHRRGLVVQKRPHRAGQIRRQLGPEVLSGVRRSDRIEHGVHHKLSPNVLRHSCRSYRMASSPTRGRLSDVAGATRS